MRFSTIRLICIFAVLWGVCHADDGLLKIQRELRARKYYFGSVDGRVSEETTNAIKAFQKDKGLDSKGPADEETLRALGLHGGKDAESDAARERSACADWVVQYWRACEKGDWAAERRFYADKVDYYDDGLVDETFIRGARRERDARWPRRKYTVLNRFASLFPGTPDEALVTVWVRTDAVSREGVERVLTEELRLRLRKTDTEWRLVQLRLHKTWPNGNRTQSQ